MSKQIYPCLWFDRQAKAAAAYYCSIFKDSKITSENPIVVNFEVKGFKFMCLNGGPQYKFSPATSFVIECDRQEEKVYSWERLGEGGRYDKSGWREEKSVVSCQMFPPI